MADSNSLSGTRYMVRPLRGIKHPASHAIQVHILHMGVRVEATPRNSLHAAAGSELLRCLEAHASLLIRADITKFHAIGIPLVERLLRAPDAGARSLNCGRCVSPKGL